MGFLKDLDFTKDEILRAENNVTDLVINEILESKDLVVHNLNFLKDYGVANFKDVYIKFPEMFLMDPSKFSNIFTKYVKDDLIDKIKNNVDIVEFL